ncbi:MAG: ParB N-terminal domain-containing protein [Gammaproteobacteria bacterium]|nr:ParB N-terminal domain-containing protein [Gammaproteobacteria bacterium]
MTTDDERSTDPEAGGDPADVVRVVAFDPDDVRPWRYHNRAGSGMDDESLDALAASIRRDGQQQLGLARRLPGGDTHAVEAVFGVRRLEACRRADVPWRAEVLDASTPDSVCAVLMHGENEWSEGVSPLENAFQWKEMLDVGVFANQSALAVDLGCHRGTVSRAIRTVTALFDEEWLERLVRPVMHEFTGRSADRLADACADAEQRRRARRRARDLVPGEIPAQALYGALFGDDPVRRNRETVFLRRKGRAGGGVVAAKIERDGGGGFNVSVRPHDQSAAELAELAEQVEALLAAETAAAAGVRLGRRLVASLSPEEAKNADRAWLEGCIWSAARASGLEWDRWRCAAVADVLRSQTDGWEHAVTRAVGGANADATGR